MSDWSEVNLDDKPAPTTEIEIVEEEVLVGQPAPTPRPAAVEEDDEADDDAGAVVDEPRKKLTRSQRLKLQRDQIGEQLRAEREEKERLRAELASIKTTQEKATADGYDYYIQTLDREGQSLRARFESAFASGETDKIWEIQEALADVKARKVQAEAERARMRPTRPSGGEAEQPTRQTTTPSQPQNPSPSKPNPLAVAWVNENRSWLEAHPALQLTARAVDQQLAGEGYDPNDPEYFDELTKRMRQYIPQDAQAPRRTTAPTIQNRGSPMSTNGKVRVTITAQDRQMAEQMGVSIEAYARQKARREAAEQTSNGYTEIV
jgi:hypothetical protein